MKLQNLNIFVSFLTIQRGCKKVMFELLVKTIQYLSQSIIQAMIYDLIVSPTPVQTN